MHNISNIQKLQKTFCFSDVFRVYRNGILGYFFPFSICRVSLIVSLASFSFLCSIFENQFLSHSSSKYHPLVFSSKTACSSHSTEMFHLHQNHLGKYLLQIFLSGYNIHRVQRGINPHPLTPWWQSLLNFSPPPSIPLDWWQTHLNSHHYKYVKRLLIAVSEVAQDTTPTYIWQPNKFRIKSILWE